jgi:hypothetical protein
MIQRSIKLPKGGVLEVETTPQFLEIVQKHFQLSSSSSISDDHIRMYVWGAFKVAIDKEDKINDVHTSS